MPRKPKSSGSDASASTLVGFKLDNDAFSVLETRANELGTSHHLLAREYVIRSLAQEEHRQAFMQNLEALLHELIQLRKDCALSTEALLVSAGQTTEQEARKWVSQNFRCE